MNRRNKLLGFPLFSMVLLLTTCGPTEGPNNELGNKIDDLFEKWDNDDTPGGAVAIIKDGEIIFKNGYGIANLEHGIFINTNSIFHIASLSKQVTAFAIVLLEQQGKLSLNDDIRKHLPYVPDFGQTITIKHLIHHTSGLRDQWQLLAIAGTRIDDVIKQDHVVKLVSNQKRLNFNPGERYMYCNTGYSLLAEIVKEVSGRSFREFTEKEVFNPLGMNDTHFHDDYEEIVPNRVSSYSSLDDGYANAVLSYSTFGATSLFTTVEDEVKWLNNYFTAQVGSQESIEQMSEQGILNSGDTLGYAFGLVTNTFKGWTSMRHGGADAGFRTHSLFFPEEKLAIAVFGNVGNFNPGGLANDIADILLEDRSQEETKADFNQDIVSTFTGRYHNDEGVFFDFIDSTKMYAKHSGGIDEMVPTSDSTFEISNGSGTLTFTNTPEKAVEFEIFNNRFILGKSEEFLPDDIDLTHYVGTYRSSEAGTRYELNIVDGQLVLSHSKYEDVVLKPFAVDQFSSPHWWMSNLVFIRNSNNKVIGFEINGGRVLHLYFDKLSI